MFWWIRTMGWICVSVFFLIWGVKEMSRAYRLTHPAEFLASFFAGSFIILISASLLLGFVWSIVIKYKNMKENKAALEK